MNSYGPLALRYDALTRDVDYAAWADFLEKHFARAGAVRDLADLACGTGSLTLELARRGYAVTGVDISPDMLAMAADKCGGLEPSPLLLCQDISRLRLINPVDAAVCCLDSLNYLTRPAALRRTFRRVWSALRPGGLFVFDLRTPEMLRSMDGQLCLDETEDTYCVWRGEFSEKRNILTYEMDLFFSNPDGTWNRAGELHEEYAYDLAEVARWLGEAGFVKVRQYGDLVLRAPKPGEGRVFFSARRPQSPACTAGTADCSHGKSREEWYEKA